MTMSALHSQGVAELWAHILNFQQLQTANGRLQARRQAQAGAWMWERIEAGLKTSFREHEAVQALLPEMVRAVNQGTMAASVAARRLLELLAK